ncbi:MAG: hypothetical protein JJ866_05110 [Roseibium sp.]|uniref:hypothetical protein n=1 Tax=Roseibium sp. TaxID=1936156 RepID=UPI001B190703|nr:hypothetical protein [Roseibium sp.]MBO6891303.1 hypothetical protein [Roseibium sp.]MBO6931606.1 hypothetical protein [Roseibium sp.]
MWLPKRQFEWLLGNFGNGQDGISVTRRRENRTSQATPAPRLKTWLKNRIRRIALKSRVFAGVNGVSLRREIKNIHENHNLIEFVAA